MRAGVSDSLTGSGCPSRLTPGGSHHRRCRLPRVAQHRRAAGGRCVWTPHRLARSPTRALRRRLHSAAAVFRLDGSPRNYSDPLVPARSEKERGKRKKGHTSRLASPLLDGDPRAEKKARTESGANSETISVTIFRANRLVSNVRGARTGPAKITLPSPRPSADFTAYPGMVCVMRCFLVLSLALALGGCSFMFEHPPDHPASSQECSSSAPIADLAAGLLLGLVAIGATTALHSPENDLAGLAVLAPFAASATYGFVRTQRCGARVGR